MRAIVTGATGFAGGQILKTLLDHPQIKEITVITRRELNENEFDLHSIKLQVIFHDDFENYDEVLPLLAGYDTCFWAIGGKAGAFPSLEEATKVTYTYATAAARAFSSLGTKDRPFTFLYLSGRYADQEEKQDLWFLKDTRHLKGRTEKALTDFANENPSFRLRIFRPGGILPFESVGWLLGAMLSNTFIGNLQLSKAMADTAFQNEDAPVIIFENNELVKIA
eukprot:Phypoly_transcript_13678.p1 GENE.Phypoly_transcript_13678~~Phypoly_transcript_13678.p1  ORF type:complete len:236 (+),score=24.25 Phypoly_transcript_13678:42-710(+)